jgi:hypothetical protein
MSDHAAIVTLQQQVMDLIQRLANANAQITQLQTAPPPAQPIINIAAAQPAMTAAPDALTAQALKLRASFTNASCISLATILLTLKRSIVPFRA